MSHEDPHREATLMDRETRAFLSARKYPIRWLEFLPVQNAWDSRSSLLCEITDVVRAYELMESSYPDTPANVNVLAVNENDKMRHDVENSNDVKIENIVVTRYDHDRENEALMRGARRDGQANVSPLCAECPTETGFAIESDNASEVHCVYLRSFTQRDCARTSRYALSLKGDSAICRFHAS